MFWTEEDKKASEDLFQNFAGFDIKVGMDRHDFAEGKLNQRQWCINAPDKHNIWRVGCGLTFAKAYNNLLIKMDEENDRL